MTDFSKDTQIITVSVDRWLQAEQKGNDYPVDFNDAWQWLEFSRKDSGLRSFLDSGFTETLDFSRSHQNVKSGILIRKLESYHLTTDCFRTWAMMVNTVKGKEIRKYFLECERQLKQLKVEQPKKAITHYTNRIMDLDKNLVKKPDTWCVIEKAGQLLLKVEKLGYQVDQFDLLDGSVGIHWSRYRKDKSWSVKSESALYHLDDHRGTREIKAYDFCELGYFAKWLETMYIPLKMPVYLDNKYGALVKV